MLRLSEKFNSSLALCIASLAFAVQATALFHRFLIPKASSLANQVTMEWQSLLRPEQEVVLFRFFVFAALAAGYGVVRFWKNPRFNLFLGVEILITFFLLSALYKQAVYADRAALAKIVTDLMLVAAILNKVFWPQIERSLNAFWVFLSDAANQPFLNQILTIAVPAFIVLAIDVPNKGALVAQFFYGEQMHHNDNFIFAAAYAYHMGAVLDIDIIGQYGVGASVVMALVMKLFGGPSYETALMFKMYGIMTYYLLCFFFLRYWLKSTAIAAAGIFFFIKLQMLHPGVFPIALTYGSATAIRYWFDIIFFFLIYAHILRPSPALLGAAAMVCGIQLFYIPSEGVYLTAAFGFYLLSRIVLHGWNKWKELLLVVVPPVTTIVLLRIFIGPHALTGEFWRNAGEFFEYFLSGFGIVPIYSSLGERHFLASLMGFVIPSVYVLTLLIVGSLLMLRKINPRHVIVCVLCVYGLAIFHYYIARSTHTSYYVASMPYAFILAFWANKIIERLKPQLQFRSKLVLMAVCLWALWTNHNFIAYPNRLNFSRNPLTDPLVAQPLPGKKPYLNHLFRESREDLKVPLNSLNEKDERLFSEQELKSDDALYQYYLQDADFAKDAQLIKQLTAPEDAAALISSFELKILMQAKRKPYFYYFPLINSRPMRGRMFPTTAIYTTDQFNKTISKLEKDKPEFIFMERMFLTRPLTQDFYYFYSSMIYLTDYVIANYELFKQGEYLVAMRRKNK